MTAPESGRVVVSRTEGRHWILAGVLFLVAGGFVWLALTPMQPSPAVPGWVFGGGFGLLGLNLVRRSVRKPVRNELIFDATGVSRAIGGVVWAARWDELAAVAVPVEPGREHSFRVVLEPADVRFAERHRGLTPVGGGAFLVPGITLSATEAGRVREVAGKHAGVAERPATPVAPKPAPRFAPGAGLVSGPATVPELDHVSIHVNGWDRRKVWFFDFVMAMLAFGSYVAAEFGPSGFLHTVCRIVLGAVIVLGGVVHAFEFTSRKRELRADLRLSNVGFRWKTYYRSLELRWREVAGLRLLANGHLEFRPADPDFPLHHGDAERLALSDGWYRLPRALSPAAVRKFRRCAPTLLPSGLALTVGGGAPPTPITRGAT